jgi:hypothetical protein
VPKHFTVTSSVWNSSCTTTYFASTEFASILSGLASVASWQDTVSSHQAFILAPVPLSCTAFVFAWMAFPSAPIFLARPSSPV